MNITTINQLVSVNIVLDQDEAMAALKDPRELQRNGNPHGTQAQIYRCPCCERLIDSGNPMVGMRCAMCVSGDLLPYG